MTTFVLARHGTAAVARALDAFTGLAADERLPVVAHHTLIRLLTCAVRGVPLAGYRRRLPVLDSVGMTTLRVPAGKRTDLLAVLAYNAPLWQLDGEHATG